MGGGGGGGGSWATVRIMHVSIKPLLRKTSPKTLLFSEMFVWNAKDFGPDVSYHRDIFTISSGFLT